MRTLFPPLFFFFTALAAAQTIQGRFSLERAEGKPVKRALNLIGRWYYNFSAQCQ